jgi:hypothetical protein
VQEIPVGKDDTDFTYSELQKGLLDLIVTHRIYQDTQLDMLFNEFMRMNKDLNFNKIDTVVARIKTILDE